MKFLFFKILLMAAVLVIMSLPFFPGKYKFSLASAGYSKKDRWKNLMFVFETMLVSSVLLFVAPYIKYFLKWLLSLGFMKWLMAYIPERVTYAIDVAIVLIANLAVCLIFFAVKKVFRAFLDRKVFKESSTGTSTQKSKKAKKQKKYSRPESERQFGKASQTASPKFRSCIFSKRKAFRVRDCNCLGLSEDYA